MNLCLRVQLSYMLVKIHVHTEDREWTIGGSYQVIKNQFEETGLCIKTIPQYGLKLKAVYVVCWQQTEKKRRQDVHLKTCQNVLNFNVSK